MEIKKRVDLVHVRHGALDFFLGWGEECAVAL